MVLTRRDIIIALEAAGWHIDSVEAHVVEASDGERYGVAVFLERGVPVAIEYGDGEEDRQHQEGWAEVPGVLSPAEATRLFREDEPRSKAGRRSGELR